MKKLLSILGTLCALLLVSTLFAACGGDDDGGQKKDDKPQTTTLKIEVNPSADLLELATVKLSYYDENGKEVNADVTGSFSKQITYKGYPLQTGYTIAVSYKNPTLTKDSYTFSIGDSYNVETSKAIKSSGVSTKYTVEKDGVKAFFDQLENYGMSIKVDKDGLVTVQKVK